MDPQQKACNITKAIIDTYKRQQECLSQYISHLEEFRNLRKVQFSHVQAAIIKIRYILSGIKIIISLQPWIQKACNFKAKLANRLTYTEELMENQK